MLVGVDRDRATGYAYNDLEITWPVATGSYRFEGDSAGGENREFQRLVDNQYDDLI